VVQIFFAEFVAEFVKVGSRDGSHKDGATGRVRKYKSRGKGIDPSYQYFEKSAKPADPVTQISRS
jgi:hypothetical protein